MNYRLCNEGGDFFISSGRNGLYRCVEADQNEYIDTDFHGTILRLRFNTRKLTNYDELLTRYRYQGEMIARQSKNGANISASKISAYIRNNFEQSEGEIAKGAQVQHMQFGVGVVMDIIPSRPEDLALVSFFGGRTKRVQLSSLLIHESASSEQNRFDDIHY